ncbi:MAG: isoprenylcysteine carboxylmethyltransferase family protein [Gammaproteobacteria bacterium]|nr:MAG: isoprenylcysteine carboxylmethyltransferase family protein [Gammaproteobacteria bacterium]
MKMLEARVPPPLIVILFGVVMWLATRYLPAPLFLAESSEESWRYPLMIALLLVAVFIFINAVMTFKKAKTTINPHTPSKSSTLVTSGVFRFSRNPLYLAMLLILIGWGLWLGSGISILLSAGFFLYIDRLQIILEERALQTIFGDEFIDYKQRVRRWL